MRYQELKIRTLNKQMGRKLGKLVAYIATFAQRYARCTLVFFALLSVTAAWYSVENFAINSNTSKLIKASKSNQWYADDQAFKKAFPQYFNTSLVVVTSNSAEAAFDVGNDVYQAFLKQPLFVEVFAPSFHTFFDEHALYTIPNDSLKSLGLKINEDFDDLARLYAAPSLANYVKPLTRSLVQDLEDGDLSSLNRNKLELLLVSIKRLDAGADTETALRQLKRLKPQSNEGLHFQLITLKAEQQFSEKLPNAKIVADIQSVLAKIDVPDNVQVRVSGEVPLANDEISAALNGIELAGLISIVLLAVILGVGIRSFNAVAAIFLMLAIGIILTSAYASLSVGDYNTLSMIFLVMFFGLGVDFAVHYVMRLKEAVQGHASTVFHESPSVLAINDIGGALALCTVTSALAFLSFLPTEYVGLAELGIISAGGMLIAFLLCVTFLPAWFAVFPLKPLSQAHASKGLEITPNTAFKLSARVVLSLTFVLLVLAGWKASALAFDYSVLAMRDDQTPAMQALLEMQEHNQFTDYSISVVLDKQVDEYELIQRLTALPEVSGVSTPQDKVAKAQQVKYDLLTPLRLRINEIVETDESVPTKPNHTEIENTASLLALLLGVVVDNDVTTLSDRDVVLFQKLASSLKALQQNPNLWSKLQTAVERGVKADVARLSMWLNAKPYRYQDLPKSLRTRFVGEQGQRLIHVHPAISTVERSQLSRFIQQVSLHAPSVAGRSVVEHGVGNLVVTAFRQAATIAACLITFLLVIYFRSVITAVIVLIPIALTTVFTFAILVVFGGSLNMANILVVPLIFGLGVDTGIHVVHRYQQSHSTEKLMRSSTSRAVLISGLTTIATFFSLSFSAHKGAASIGVLLAVAIGLLLLTTFTVLPALLETRARRASR